MIKRQAQQCDYKIYQIKLGIAYHTIGLQLSLALDVGQLHLEHEGGASGDFLAGPGVPVAEVRGDHQLPLLSDTHPQQALVPALDNLST